jgi:CBS domain-containing protein
MEMKCVGEIMLPLELFPYIPYWFTLRQALAELGSVGAARESGRRTPWIILVFNPQNRFLGIVQREDILRGLRPGMNDKSPGIHSAYSGTSPDSDLSRLSFTPVKAVRELKDQIERQVVEFMRPLQTTVEYQDPVLLAMYLMIDHGLAFVPVVKSGEVVGIVYVEDVLSEVIAPVI